MGTLKLIKNLKIKNLMKNFKISTEAFQIANSKNKDLKNRLSIICNLLKRWKKIKIKIDILILM